MVNSTQAEIIVNHTSKYFLNASFFRSNNKRRKWKKMLLLMKTTSSQKIPKNQTAGKEKVVAANASIQIIPACWPFWYITQVITFYLSHYIYSLHMGHFCFGKICKCVNPNHLSMFTLLIFLTQLPGETFPWLLSIGSQTHLFITGYRSTQPTSTSALTLDFLSPVR